MLSFADIQHILLIKFCLVGFVAAGLVCLYRRTHPLVFLSITGLLVSGAYLLLVDDLQLLFWGLSGDEVTIAAMYETFAHGSFWSDFGFHHLPPFYPPLFFWLLAIPGRLFDWNGVQIAKAGTACVFLFFPAVLYVVQAAYAKYTRLKDGALPGRLAWFLSVFIIFIVTDWDAFILKPYEVVAAAFAVLWVTYLLQDLHTNQWNTRRWLAYGFIGGLLFMLYYLWLIFGAIAMALSGLFVQKKDQTRFYIRLIITAVLTLIVASPYLGPLVAVYLKNGTENWSAALMTMRGLSLYVLPVQWFSWRGLLLLAGVSVLIIYRHIVYIRSLGLLFVAGYVWQIMGWGTVLFFATPIQEFKAFDFFHLVILALALSYGIEQVYEKAAKRFRNEALYKASGLFGLFFVSAFMLFGSFIDDPVVQERRIKSRYVREPVAELITFLQQVPSSFPGPITVEPGIGEIHAFVPVNSYIYFNQHNNHPATRFSEKKAALQSLTYHGDSNAFYDAVQALPYGPVERFILFKKDQNYAAFLHVDRFPNGAADETWLIDQKAFQEPYFSKQFENEQFVVFEVN